MTILILALIIFSLSIWIVVLYFNYRKTKAKLQTEYNRNDEYIKLANAAVEFNKRIYEKQIDELKRDIRVLITVSPEQKREVKQRWEIRFREEHLFSNLKR